MKDSKENSKNKVQLFIAVSLLVIIIIGAVTGTVLFLSDNDGHKPATQNKPLFGVWWWDNRLDSSYLDFAEENGVTEIYCYYSSFGQKTTDFIKSASEKNIDVLWLAGKYEWIEDYDSLKAKVGEFLDFQQSSEYKFKGIHLDIEPRAVLAVIVAGMYYIILRKERSTFCSIDFNTKKGKRLLADTMVKIIVYLNKQGEQNKKVMEIARILKQNNVDERIIIESTGISKDELAIL